MGLRPELAKAVSFLRERYRAAWTENPQELFLFPGRDVDGCKVARIEDSTGYVLGGAALFEKCRWYGGVLSFQLFAMVSGREMRITSRGTGENIADIEIENETAGMTGWKRKWFKPLTLSLTTPVRNFSVQIWGDSFVMSDSNVHLMLNGGPVHDLPLSKNQIFPSTCHWDGDPFILACMLFVKMQMGSLWQGFS